MNDELWRAVVGYEGFYEVSNHGRVRALFASRNNRHKAGRILNTTSQKVEYYQINMCPPGCKRTHIAVHVMVLEAFVGPRPDGNVCRHLDGNPKNNHVSNLAWGTLEENEEDKMRHGRAMVGSRNHAAKLNEESVLKLRYLACLGVPTKHLINVFKVSKSTINRAKRRFNWSHV